jgi:hypothetical protein
MEDCGISLNGDELNGERYKLPACHGFTNKPLPRKRGIITKKDLAIVTVCTSGLIVIACWLFSALPKAVAIINQFCN